MPVSPRRCSARYGLRGVRVGEVNHPSPSSFLRLRRDTSVVVVAATQVDPGRFSALDEELSDTEVNEGDDEACKPRLSANVKVADDVQVTAEGLPNFESVPVEVAMSDAEDPTVGRRRLVSVSQEEVAPTVMDVLSVVSGESHARPSEAESDV